MLLAAGIVVLLLIAVLASAVLCGPAPDPTSRLLFWIAELQVAVSGLKIAMRERRRLSRTNARTLGAMVCHQCADKKKGVFFLFFFLRSHQMVSSFAIPG